MRQANNRAEARADQEKAAKQIAEEKAKQTKDRELRDVGRKIAQATSNNLYFERQVSGNCGVHALNNGLQGEYFTAEMLHAFAAQYNLEQTNLVYADDRSNIEGSSTAAGFFDINVLDLALRSINYELRHLDERWNVRWLEEFATKEGIFLVNRNENHWYAIRKFSRRCPGFLFDSLRGGPVTIRDINNEFPVINGYQEPNRYILAEIVRSQPNGPAVRAAPAASSTPISTNNKATKLSQKTPQSKN